MRPADNALCAACDHAFGGHYQTFDGKGFGCSGRTSTRADAAICKCRGYMVRWSPLLLPEMRALSAGQVVAGAEVLPRG